MVAPGVDEAVGPAVQVDGELFPVFGGLETGDPIRPIVFIIFAKGEEVALHTVNFKGETGPLLGLAGPGTHGKDCTITLYGSHRGLYSGNFASTLERGRWLRL